ncbi:MAG: UDP-glucose 4-epimerase GalE [Candidatus Lambdaproteobacteria bacterium]|nr:UDP-glucose 4-epimerase GalE [Candidatus Lambdaproteobacteria bacterium]
MRCLVTGGAGYIGSHVVLLLGEAGHDVIVYDNLSTGFPWAVLAGELIVGDTGDHELLDAVFAEHGFDVVLHFAAHIIVPESVADPLKYYRNNTANSLALLEACRKHRVRQFVFSSTAAVYGDPARVPIAEDAPCAPINPYGHSKYMSERMLRDVAAATDLRYVILRYFNVAGADLQGRLGQATPQATHLIKLACEAALGKRDRLEVFGTDYPTPDGTCIRDYLHVADLARVHVQALEYLRRGGASTVLNCGYGHGASVKEVIEMVKRVSGRDFPVHNAERRPGDPPQLVAANARILSTLGWRPAHDDLETIVRSALQWEAKLPVAGG